MREVTSSPADLPDAFVRLVPSRRQVLEQRSLKSPIRFTRVELATARLVERVHHLAENI